MFPEQTAVAPVYEAPAPEVEMLAPATSRMFVFKTPSIKKVVSLFETRSPFAT